MNDNDMMRRMLDAFPEAEAGTDNDGQFVIYTAFYRDQNGTYHTDSAPNFEWCVVELDGTVIERFDTFVGAKESVEQDYPEGTKDVHWIDNPVLSPSYLRVVSDS